MNPNNIDDRVFMLVSLFLLAIIFLMSLIQFIAWLIVTFVFKKQKTNKKFYQALLEQEQLDDIEIKKVKLVIKFNNFNKNKNYLKLKTNDFEEKSLWNIYQNLISILLIKWKKTNKKINIILISSTLIFYISVSLAITFALIYYINLWQNTINTLNTTLLSILSFANLIILVLSWLIWTMTYERVRKELIELAATLKNPTILKVIKWISSYKTLFPGSELLL